MTRVLLVGSQPLEYAGGVERFCRTVLKGCSQLGLEAHYVAASQLVPTPLLRVPMPSLWSGTAEVLAARLRIRESADIVITNGPIGWGVEARAHSAHIYHGTYYSQAAQIREFITYRGFLKMRYWDSKVLERLAGKGKVCLATTSAVAADVEAVLGHTCEVVGYPLDLEAFTPGERDTSSLRNLGVPTDRPVILTVGFGTPVKDPATVISLGRELPAVTILALGRPAQLPYKRLPRNVLLRDPIPPSGMPALLRAVDLVLMASKYESLGLVALEALACGTPALVSSQSGAAEMLQRVDALRRLIIPPGATGKEIVSLATELLSDRTSREALLDLRREMWKGVEPASWVRSVLERIREH